MSTPPIVVPITAQDLSGPAFGSASAKATAFKASVEGMGGSFRETNAAARLLNEELGTHMNRHLTSIMAASSMLGPALELAFPIAVAVGFGEVLAKIGTSLGKWYFDTAGVEAFKNELASTTAEMVKLMAETARFNAEAAGVGASAQQKWATQLELDTAALKRQEQSVSNLSNIIYKLKQGQAESMGGGLSIAGNTTKDIPALQNLYAKAVTDVADLKAKQGLAQAELTNAQRQGMEEYQTKMEQATAKAKAHRLELEKSLEAVMKMVDKIGVLGYSQESLTRTNYNRMPLEAGTDRMMAVAEPDPAVAQKNLQRIKDMSGWYDATRTSAEKYAQAVTNLNATFGAGQKDSDLYNRALDQIKNQFDTQTIAAAKMAAEQSKAWHELGREVSQNIMSAAFMKESWGAALKSILEDVAKLIIQLSMMQLLSQWSKSGGGGGIGAAFVSGLAGMATGGPVSAGASYLIGEKGPELFTPGRSGTITPNGGVGGVTNIIDARGADVSVEQRIMRLLPIIENRAVQRSVNAVQDRNLRR